MPNGSISYTRAGSLKVNSEGQLVTAQGYLLEPNISIPDDAKGDVNFSPDGTVTAIMQAGELPEQIGQLELARFINPGGLKSLGGNLYAESDASGPAMVGAPGEDNMGTLRSQFLEMSNVQMVEEMVNMIVAQRAYEVASKAITTSDDMLQTANQLKR
jgi:flagellar basal-body rod protein FlgG